MFWKFSYTTSQIQTILEKPDVTLQEILEEDDVLQECKSNNEKLVSFLTQYDNLNQMLSYITVYPSHDQNENSQFKYSTIASELLTCDAPAISESLIGNIEFIDKLYSFLYGDTPLNPLLASYFSKVIGSLINRKTEALLCYLQTKNDFVDLLLKHINTSAIMDVLLRLLTTIENAELKQRVLNWLNDMNLIKNLISLFSSKYSNEVHSNVSQLLCDIIRIIREQILSQRELLRENIAFNALSNNDYNNSNSNDQNNIDYSNITNPLLDSLESTETLNILLDLMFESANTQNSSLSYGIDVLLTLLEPKTSTIEFITDIKSLEQERLLKEQERIVIALRGIKCVTDASVSRLKSFYEFLSKQNENAVPFELTYGSLKVPFGTTRLNIVKLVAKLIATNNSNVNEELKNTGILNKILDFAFEYKWNNFLHIQTTNILNSLFNNSVANANLSNNAENEINENGTNNSVSIIEHLFRDYNLVDKLLQAWKQYFESSAYNPKTGKRENNAGYIGQLTTISNLITKNTKEGQFSTFLQSYFDGLNKETGEQWKEFEETKLTEINRKNTQDLVRNPLISCSTDSNNENEFIDLPSDENMQRKFADLSKDMTPTYADSFGISENNITNLFGKNPEGFSKLQNLAFQSFHLDTNEENVLRAQLFDQICSQRDNMRETVGDVNDEDVWVACEIKYAETHDAIEKTPPSNRINFSDNSSSSSSEDEDDQNFHPHKHISNSRGSETVVTSTTITTTTTLMATNEDFAFNQNDNCEQQMDFTSVPTNTFGETNWADFSNLPNQNILENNATNESSNIKTDEKPSVPATTVNNSSHEEDQNWANFDSFNQLGNERCSSPNDTPPFLQSNNQMETGDRAKTYVYTDLKQQQQINTKEGSPTSEVKTENTNSPLERTSQVIESTLETMNTVTSTSSTETATLITNTVYLDNKTLVIENQEINVITQTISEDDDSIPMESTNTIGEN